MDFWPKKQTLTRFWNREYEKDEKSKFKIKTVMLYKKIIFIFSSFSKREKRIEMMELTVGVEHLTCEPHLWRAKGIIRWETEDCRKNSTFKTCVLRTPKTEREYWLSFCSYIFIIFFLGIRAKVMSLSKKDCVYPAHRHWSHKENWTGLESGFQQNCVWCEEQTETCAHYKYLRIRIQEIQKQKNVECLKSSLTKTDKKEKIKREFLSRKSKTSWYNANWNDHNCDHKCLIVYKEIFCPCNWLLQRNVETFVKGTLKLQLVREPTSNDFRS